VAAAPAFAFTINVLLTAASYLYQSCRYRLFYNDAARCLAFAGWWRQREGVGDDYLFVAGRYDGGRRRRGWKRGANLGDSAASDIGGVIISVTASCHKRVTTPRSFTWWTILALLDCCATGVFADAS